MVRILLLAFLALGLATESEATRFYKWVDEDGVVHYSDSPPDHSRYEQIETRDPASTFEELDAFGDEDEEEGDTAPPPPRAPQSAEEARRMNCENARRNLETLNSFSNIQMDLDGDGELENLDETQKQEQIERFQAQIERFCDDASSPQDDDWDE